MYTLYVFRKQRQLFFLIFVKIESVSYRLKMKIVSASNDIEDIRSSRTKDGRPRISGAVPPLYERAGEIIAGQIHSGEIPVGTRLSETSVATRFGFSRTPARQALTWLQNANLVSKAGGRGYIVSGTKSAAAP